jgi:hypothetical protein
VRSDQFVYWLQGFFELAGARATTLDVTQVACIQKHLALVFLHEIDPSAGDAAVQEKLNAAHAGKLPAPAWEQHPSPPTLYRC